MNWSGERGSTIPLLLGFVVVAFLVVAGSVAAGDAFVQQQDLQDTCDGAAAAAASAADFPAVRAGTSGDASLPLAGVQAAVATYLGRDPSRSAVSAAATVTGGQTVTVICRTHELIAFGGVFGLGGGIDHRVTSSARSPILGP